MISSQQCNIFIQHAVRKTISLCKICKTLFSFCGFRQVRHIFSTYIAIIFAQHTISKPQHTNRKGEIKVMTNTKNGSNQGMVPEARAAMDQFKMEAASEVGVNLKAGL